ncbi:MAG: L-threonylcarbamoyladenylate synthase [bacterium]|nr:L-threonylcarbamoyladenylate synthase [bacterium]
MNSVLLKENNTEEVIAQAVSVLKSGGIVIYPTETIYGMGVDATNQEAVNKLLRYRSRREGKPLSVAVSDAQMAEVYVEANSVARNLYMNFLPGPLTVVSISKRKVAQGIEAENNTLGIRIPDYELVRKITEALGKPIVATTAAPASMKKRPYTVSDILENISEKQKDLIDLIIDAGTLPKREPSTVVDTTLNQEVVLRQGSINLNQVLETKTHSADETQQLGYDLMKKYVHHLGYKSVIFALQGELGAGKTQMSKGIARALEIPDLIQSPTFSIENEYVIKNKYLYHIDTWRLSGSHELLDLNFVTHVEEGNVFIIEWADKVRDVIEQVSSDAIIVWVGLQYGENENQRLIKVSDYSL